MKRNIHNLLLLLAFSTSAQPLMKWTKQFHGHDTTADVVNINDICTDQHGNIYTAGLFYGFTDFDPGSGSSIDTSIWFGFFVTKQDPSGNLVWRHLVDLTQNANNNAHSICCAIDVDQYGHVYFAGTYNRPTDFNPGPDSVVLTPQGWQEMYVCKLNKNGKFMWVRSMGGQGSSQCFPLDLKVDEADDLVICGYYAYGPMDFNPGPAVNSYTNYGGEDLYILKLDSAGSFKWVTTFNNDGILRALAIDKHNNIFLTGEFWNSLYIPASPQPIQLYEKGDRDLVFMKADPMGHIQWAKSVGGFGPGVNPAMGWAIGLDSQNDIYIAGSFHYTVDIDPGPSATTLSANGLSDACILKYDSTGNLLWGKAVGSKNYDYAYNLQVLPDASVYWSGHFMDTTDLDPGPKTAFEYPPYLADYNAHHAMMLAAFDASGNYVCGGSLPGLHGSLAWSTQGLIATGGLRTPSDFQPGPTVQIISPYGAGDAYVTLLDPCATINGIKNVENNLQVSIYPNPTEGTFWIKNLPVHSSAEIIDCSGNPVYTVESMGEEVDLSALTPGIYFLILKTEKEICRFKLIRK